MAMTLRLTDRETDALRRRAELEGRSMQDVARQAVRDYIERNSKRELLDRVLDAELPRYAEALERLGQGSPPPSPPCRTPPNGPWGTSRRATSACWTLRRRARGRRRSARRPIPRSTTSPPRCSPHSPGPSRWSTATSGWHLLRPSPSTASTG